MKNSFFNKFCQAKTDNLQYSNIDPLFKSFSLSSILTTLGIAKKKGITVLELLFYMFALLLDNSRSVRAGLINLKLYKHKSAINDFLNNTEFNWRDLLYSVAKKYTSKYSHSKEKYSVLIIDDTDKKKYGQKTEFISKFYSHSEHSYFYGYQVVVSAISNLRTCIPFDFCLKVSNKVQKKHKRAFYHKNSHIYERYIESQKTKIEISLDIIKRALKKRFKFSYILWDSWYNCSQAYDFVFNKLVPKGIHLVSMIKLGNTKYSFMNKELNIKEICNITGVWKNDPINGIRYKSAIIEVKVNNTKGNLEKRQAKICFYRFPGQNKRQYKALISTDITLSEMDILERYLHRWSIEVLFKDLKQHFRFNQSKSSKYAPQIADLSIKMIFYIMVCSLKEKQPGKSIYQLLFEFSKEIEETCFELFLLYMFKMKCIDFLKYSLKKNILSVHELICNYDSTIETFFNSEWYEDKIVEAELYQNKEIA